MVYMAEGNFSLYTFLIEIDQFVVALPLGLATSVQGELDWDCLYTLNINTSYSQVCQSLRDGMLKPQTAKYLSDSEHEETSVTHLYTYNLKQDVTK